MEARDVAKAIEEKMENKAAPSPSPRPMLVGDPACNANQSQTGPNALLQPCPVPAPPLLAVAFQAGSTGKTFGNSCGGNLGRVKCETAFYWSWCAVACNNK